MHSADIFREKNSWKWGWGGGGVGETSVSGQSRVGEIVVTGVLTWAGRRTNNSSKWGS